MKIVIIKPSNNFINCYNNHIYETFEINKLNDFSLTINIFNKNYYITKSGYVNVEDCMFLKDYLKMVRSNKLERLLKIL